MNERLVQLAKLRLARFEHTAVHTEHNQTTLYRGRNTMAGSGLFTRHIDTRPLLLTSLLYIVKSSVPEYTHNYSPGSGGFLRRLSYPGCEKQ